jgi:hypothetical protein
MPVSKAGLTIQLSFNAQAMAYTSNSTPEQVCSTPLQLRWMDRGRLSAMSFQTAALFPTQAVMILGWDNIHALRGRGVMLIEILQAPDITNIDGTYFLYYAVSTFGTQNSAIGLATRYARYASHINFQ